MDGVYPAILLNGSLAKVQNDYLHAYRPEVGFSYHPALLSSHACSLISSCLELLITISAGLIYAQ